MEEFVVDRERWLNGEVRKAASSMDSCLLEPQSGLMCCLGQYARHKGVPDIVLKDVASPGFLDSCYQGAFPDELLALKNRGQYEDSTLAQQIMGLNDRTDLTPEERESELTRLFAGLDIKLSFRGSTTVAIERALDTSDRLGHTALVA